MKQLEEIKKELDAGADKAVIIKELTAYIESCPGDAQGYVQRGMVYWSMGERAKTINDYLAALKIDPECQAKQALKAVYSILDYYNKDLYNP